MRPSPVNRPPKRVQHKRGIALPPNTRLVARPSRWGNPFRIRRWHGRWEVWTDYLIGQDVLDGTQRYFREQRAAHVRAVDLFSAHCGPFGSFEIEQADIELLRGHDLACWCPLDMPCHADTLIEWANR